MNQVGETARHIFSELKGNPLVLFMLVINLVFIVLIFIAVRESSARGDELVREMVQLLAQCRGGT